MPKHDPMSAKAIGNRQKTVGLQRLRWYCQMCQKQCRDENGFKCHTMSESHLRQMRVFAENPNSVLDEFSSEFERGYLETLNQLHGTKRVKANKVYQEYIQDKHHIHMNATIWTTLTGFCMHLGKESKAIVDETEKGWFIQYIDRDPKVLARQAQNEQRQRFELDEEERRKREILAQVQAAEERKRGENGDEEEYAEVDNTLNREHNDQKIAVTLGAPATSLSVGLKKRPRAVLGFAESEDEEEPQAKKNDAGAVNGNQKSTTESTTAHSTGQETGVGGGITSASIAGRVVTSAGRVVPLGSNAGGGVLAQMMLEEERRKAKQNNHYASSQLSQSQSQAQRTFSEAVPTSSKALAVEKKPTKSHTSYGSWLYKNIVVKVVNKEVARGRLYKLKGRVVRLLGRDYEEAEVDIEGEVYTLHYKDLETTLPKVGHSLLVLSGPAKGLEGELLCIHEDKFNCDVRVTQRGNSLTGEELRGLEYDHVCKYSP